MLDKLWTWLKGLPWWAWCLGVPVIIAALALLGSGCGGLLGIFKRAPPPQSPGVSPEEGKKLKEQATSIADAAVHAAESYAAGERDRLGEKFGRKP
jgi:hypothetical protein